MEIRVEFPNGVAVYAIDDEVAELFAKAGVSAVALAVESGSDHVLNNIIRKPLKKRLIRPAVEALRKFNVRSHVFIVIGLPGEQDEHRAETLQMLIDSGFDWVHVYLAMPIFGSRSTIFASRTAISTIRIRRISLPRSRSSVHRSRSGQARGLCLRDAVAREFRRKSQYEDGPLRRPDGLSEKRRQQISGSRFRALFSRQMLSARRERAFAEEHFSRFLEICDRDDWWRNMAEKYGVHFHVAPSVASSTDQRVLQAAL